MTVAIPLDMVRTFAVELGRDKHLAARLILGHQAHGMIKLPRTVVKGRDIGKHTELLADDGNRLCLPRMADVDQDGFQLREVYGHLTHVGRPSILHVYAAGERRAVCVITGRPCRWQEAYTA
jgi:hypothetical protein